MAVGHGKIPRARDRLDALIDSIKGVPFTIPAHVKGRVISKSEVIEELKAIKAMLYREPAARIAPRQTRSLTAEQAEEVRAYARANPDATMQSIAVKFNTNTGRVSEAVNHLR